MEIRTYPSPAAAAEAAADVLATALRSGIENRGSASVAVSGGSTAPPMLAALAVADLDWSSVGIWQVDERIAPDGDPARNANQLAGLPGLVHLMPVTPADGDVAGAAAQYADSLPDTFDVIHLGLGSDGHTASWPPDQPQVAESSGLVVVTDEFNGRRRMTLTAEVVNAAEQRVVLAVGSSKADVAGRWVGGDPTLPISNLAETGTISVFDVGAASDLMV